MSDESSFRVELEQFSGPMDLLLHLLREEELDALEIPVARVCDRYVSHLEGLDQIELDAAGEFLVMASILMRMKSQAMLPEEERVLDDEDLDPRFELVRQLIQYRRFKQVAGVLDERRRAAARQFERGMHPERGDEIDRGTTEITVDGDGVELLFTAFARLLSEIRTGGDYVITVDDTPMEVHLSRVEMVLAAGLPIDFRELVPKGASRGVVIGVFLALLELLKRGRILVEQETSFGEIVVRGVDPDVDRDVDPDATAGDAEAPEDPMGATEATEIRP